MLTLIILLAISCGEAPKDKTNTPDESSMIEGFWKRTGMVQFVNGKPVDTLYYADGDLDPPGKDFIQMKAFLDGNIFWIMNNKDKTLLGKVQWVDMENLKLKKIQ